MVQKETALIAMLYLMVCCVIKNYFAVLKFRWKSLDKDDVSIAMAGTSKSVKWIGCVYKWKKK